VVVDGETGLLALFEDYDERRGGRRGAPTRAGALLRPGGRWRAVETFSWRRIAKQTVALYESLV